MVPDTVLCPAGVILGLAASLLCPVLPAEAKSDYEIINTGIKGGGCWVDDNHFIVVKGQQPAPGQEFEVEGLYYLDPNQPKDLKRIDLAPLEPSLQNHIRDVTCQGDTILFNVMASHRKTTRLYGVKIGQQPELIADLRWAKPSAVSLKGQYVVGNKLTVDKGVWEEQSDCDVRFVKPGFSVLCWPRDTIGQWVTPQFVIKEYLWRESILVKTSDGKRERVRNPAPPLKLADETELKRGYLLRDLENHVLQEISMRQGVYRIDALSFQLNPGGNYLYARCSKEGDYNPKKTFFGRICRFQTTGIIKQWEEVFSVQKEPNERASLYDLDVNDAGDVVVLRRAYRASPALWKYTERDRAVVELRIPQLDQGVGAVRLAPDGRTISYVEKGHLTFVRVGGGKR
jgi:hypothetical protein